MAEGCNLSSELRVFLHHLYELEKGVRKMVLFTMSAENEIWAVNRLKKRKLAYHVQRVNERKVNLFFGREECVAVIKSFLDRPLNALTAEEDFVLGMLLGYDLCDQCKRFCSMKKRVRLAM